MHLYGVQYYVVHTIACQNTLNLSESDALHIDLIE